MSSTIAAAASASPTAPIKAPPQGGVLEGVNPVHFDAKNPIILFIVQVRRFQHVDIVASGGFKLEVAWGEG